MFGALILFFDIFLPYLSNWYTWGFWPNLSMLAVRPPFQRLSAYGIASTPYVVLLYSIINEFPNCRRRIRICYRLLLSSFSSSFSGFSSSFFKLIFCSRVVFQANSNIKQATMSPGKPNAFKESKSSDKRVEKSAALAVRFEGLTVPQAMKAAGSKRCPKPRRTANDFL